MKLTSDKRAYWEFGKFISIHSDSGLSVRDALRELETELEGTGRKAPHEGTASKLRKAYKVYVEEYGIPMDDLVDLSALNLWQAHTELGLARNKKEALVLINRLNNGENFNRIRAKKGASKKSKAEQYIDSISRAADFANSKNQAQSTEVRELLQTYQVSVKAQRENPLVADRLFVGFCLKLIETALKD